MNVLVYKDEGVSQGPLSNVLSVLRRHLATAYDVLTVSAEVLATQPWEDSTVLLVIPGGRDAPYRDALKGDALRRIQRFIRVRGGAYLGVCAGAYFGATSIVFERSRPDYEIIQDDGRLEFIPQAIGSVVSNFQYGSEDGARLIHTILYGDAASAAQCTTLGFYVNGGPCFPNIDPATTTILASYPTNDSVIPEARGQPAIIEVAVGRGVAILSGVHIEFLLREDSAVLDPNESHRLAVLRLLFSRLRLKVSDLNAPLSSSSSSTSVISATDSAIGALRHPVISSSPIEKQTSSRPNVPPNVDGVPIVYYCASGKGLDHMRELTSKIPSPDPRAVVDILGSFQQTHVDKEAYDYISKRLHRDSYNIMFVETDVSLSPNDNFLASRMLNSFINSETVKSLVINKEDKAPERKCLALVSLQQLSPNEKKEKLFFDLDLYKSYLPEELRTKLMFYAPHMPSTQTFLEKNEILRHYMAPLTLCLSSHQTAGRGRGTNSWVSQLGCLQFSMTLPSMDAKGIVFIQYICVLSLCETLQELGVSECGIKWPNDLYLCGKKISGALISCNWSNDHFDIIIGVGVNVSNESPTYSINEYMRSISAPEITEELLLARMYQRTSQMLTEFKLSGYDFKHLFSQRYYQRWFHNGQKIVLVDHDNVHGTVDGLTDDGFLSVRDEFGKMHALQPNGNSFDMMKGLISRKK